MSDRTCDWPHVIMSPDEERALTAMIERFEPFIQDQAADLSQGAPQMAADLEQEARILLWRWGVERVGSFPAVYVRTAITWRMHDVRNADLLRAVGEPTPDDQSKVA